MNLYLNHFGLRDAPFRITPATDAFFTGAKRGSILAALLYAIESGEGLIKVTGEVGSGKTLLSRMLTEQLPGNTDTIYIATPSLSRHEVLQTLADELGLAGTAERPGQVLRSLQNTLVARYGQGRRVVVIVDEAHAMPQESLDQIRLLSNLESGRDKLLQIALFGQPELDELLASHALRPLRDRITHSFSLPPLDQEAVREYIEFRLQAAGHRGPSLFSPKAVAVIARASAGRTRRINILADKSLLSAFAANRPGVEKDDAERAAKDCRLTDGRRKTAYFQRLPHLLLAAGALGIALATGWVAHSLAISSPPPPKEAALSSASPPQATPPAARPAPTGSSEPATMAITAPQPTETIPTPPALVIQLAFSDSLAAPWFAAFRAQAASLLGPDQVRAIPTRIAGREVVALCTGSYTTRDQAIAAATQLPEALRRHQPQVRSLAGLDSALRNISQK
ncbi:MAG: family ATPase [Rhodocyclaceae bacterium]|nr:family ATPase [Rhodocyclaceae bacterium]